MKLVETFVSINGEGIFQGYPTFFIRFAGCNLRCNYCDTTYSYDGGEEVTVQDIVNKVVVSGLPRVTITGGEPLMQGNDMYMLCNQLTRFGYKVEVETNGSFDISELPFTNNVCVTMDWKLPDSGMMDKMHEPNMQFLDKKDVLKFVCSSMDDLKMAKGLLNYYKPKCTVIFSPVFGRIDPKEIVQFLLDNKMYDCRVQLQIHKVIWPQEMRGV